MHRIKKKNIFIKYKCVQLVLKNMLMPKFTQLHQNCKNV